MRKVNMNSDPDLISFKDAQMLYSLSFTTLRKVARLADAVVKLTETSRPLINCKVLEAYFEQSRSAW